MRRALVTIWTVVALGALAGCGVFKSTPSNINIDIDAGNGNGNQVLAPTPTPSPTPAALNLRAERLANAAGHASSFRVTWEGGASYDVLTIRASDLLAQTFAAQSSGAALDPGEPGQGAGDWTVRLLRAGAVVAETTVKLDS